MNHEEVRLALSELLDGELAEAERLEIQGHLSRCSDCAAAYDRLQRVAKLLKAPQAAAAADTERFARDVLACLPGRLKPAVQRPWPYFRFLVPALSAGVAVIFLAIANPGTSGLDDLFAGPAEVAEQELDFVMGER